jgi:iron complex outermembrane recepter protein
MTARTYVWLMRRVLAILAGLLGIGLRAQTVTINLAPQPLSHALSALASVEGVNILAPEALVTNREAPGVSGTLTVRDALERLLQGTRLDAGQRDEKTYAVRRRVPAPQSTSETNAPNAELVVCLPNIAASADTPALHTTRFPRVITQDFIGNPET